MSQKNVCSRAVKTRSFISQDKSSFPNVKFMIFVTFENRDKTCSKTEKTRRNFSLVARCSLLVEIHSLLVTRCKIHSLLPAKVSRCKKSLVTRCRSCSLQKMTRYSLQDSLVTRCRSCSLQKFTHFSLQNSLVACYRRCSL